MPKFKERSMKNKLEIVKIAVYYKLFSDVCVAVLISLAASFNIQCMQVWYSLVILILFRSIYTEYFKGVSAHQPPYQGKNCCSCLLKRYAC